VTTLGAGRTATIAVLANRHPVAVGHVDLDPDIMAGGTARRHPDGHRRPGRRWIEVGHLEQVFGSFIDLSPGPLAWHKAANQSNACKCVTCMQLRPFGRNPRNIVLSFEATVDAGFTHRRLTRQEIFSSSAMIDRFLDRGQGRGPVFHTTGLALLG
jgi:hypothetical protein